MTDRLLVLNHGHVEYVDHYGSDLTVVNAARVSFGKASPEWQPGRDEMLVDYLAKNKHMSPFRHCAMTFRIKMPIFVMRQFVRHRVGVEINEISGRYSELPEEYYFPREWRKQATVNKQGSEGVLDEPIGEMMDECYGAAVQHAFKAYHQLLENGVAREMARMVLPVATYTEIFVTMSLEAIAHFCKLREDGHAQYEIREYANAMKAMTTEKFPVSFTALMANN